MNYKRKNKTHRALGKLEEWGSPKVIRTLKKCDKHRKRKQDRDCRSEYSEKSKQKKKKVKILGKEKSCLVGRP